MFVSPPEAQKPSVHSTFVRQPSGWQPPKLGCNDLAAFNTSCVHTSHTHALAVLQFPVSSLEYKPAVCGFNSFPISYRSHLHNNLPLGIHAKSYFFKLCRSKVILKTMLSNQFDNSIYSYILCYSTHRGLHIVKFVKDQI